MGGCPPPAGSGKLKAVEDQRPASREARTARGWEDRAAVRPGADSWRPAVRASSWQPGSRSELQTGKGGRAP